MRNRFLPFVNALMVALLVGLVILLLGSSNFSQAQTNQNLLRVNPPNNSTKHVSLGEGIWNAFKTNTSLGYYVQILGPTLTTTNETYNAFTENRSPIQSFHALNLRYTLPKNFAVGASAAGVRHHSGSIDTEYGQISNKAELFNPRAYVSFPSIKFKHLTVFNTLAYEFPYSQISKDNEMKFGLVLSQSYAVKMPAESRFSAGVMTQFLRYFYEENELAPICTGCTGIALQTVIISGGPYVNYNLNDKWRVSQSVTFDWDQKGKQTGTTNFNNNLPDRWRTSLSYSPNIKYFSQVGVFFQGLTKLDSKSTVLGGDMSFRF